MRYLRQIRLPEIGQFGQQVIGKSRVLVVGAGGLGHPVIQYLAALGVGSIGVVDGDVVSESNLHRQILFDANDIGKNKATVIHNKFRLRKEPCEIIPYDRYLTKSLALELFLQYDLIIDGTDNFDSKFLINDVCLLYSKPMIYGSVSQFEGQLSVFWKGRGPCYRCLHSEKPRSQIENCAEAGVIGISPGIIGAMQAMEAFKIIMILNEDQRTFSSLLGYLQVFNFIDASVVKLALPVLKTCLCQKTDFQIQDIEHGNFTMCYRSDVSDLLDVRETDEYSNQEDLRIERWPMSKLLNGEFPNYQMDRKIVTICKSGARAEKSAEILRSKGYYGASFTMESIDEYQVGPKS
ncbi:MAG: HesA/MoeB/ThiF family protein [Oligoflexia bacterium]|nr:HesA/MoeB/ThiF family protein [Oligoflexia bacterium]